MNGLLIEERRLRAWSAYAAMAAGVLLGACSSNSGPPAGECPAAGGCGNDEGGAGGIGGAGNASAMSSSTSGVGGTTVDAGPSCQPTSDVDAPDDDFTDTNCDGIDGDVAHAIFVAPSGSDEAAGTKEAPVAHVQKGIALAQAAGKDVYVCNGTYAEALLIETTPVSLYGGYDCTAGWERSTDRPKVAPQKGIPLSIRNVKDAVHIDRVAFLAPGGVDPGESSTAAYVVASADVRLTNAVLAAQDGADGAAGATVDSLPALGPSPDGQSLPYGVCPTPTGAQCYTVANGGLYTGIANPPNGGRGGNSYLSIAPEAGHSAPGGAPGGAAAYGVGYGGVPGAKGAVQGPYGVASTADLGGIGPEGYLASNGGTDGGTGSQGQSGGGGAGGLSVLPCFKDVCPKTPYAVGGGGGAGGLGGAGGAGGKAGGGGGASIALLTSESVVTASWCTLKTGSGGRGGGGSQGANGQVGGAGGKGGTGTESNGYADGHPGGAGGNGAPGGAGGPGGGGPSIGILAQGALPKTASTQFQVGVGGKGGVGVSGADGADGRTADVVVLDAPMTGP